MRKFTHALGAVAALSLLAVAACERADFQPDSPISGTVDPSANRAAPPKDNVFPAPFTVVATGFPESFEAGSKSSYTAADVSLGSGSWRLTDALLGTLSGDAKNGAKSVRITASGSARMNFDSPDGASTLSVKHALYGADPSATWQLWRSSNSGTSWTQVGATVTTSSTTLQTATFTVNQTGAVRFEIRKVSGTGRLNFDDFTFDTYGSTGGGGGTGGGATRDSNLGMGNPSGAVANSSTSPNNFLMDKPMYALSYNNTKKVPNWVSWHLSTAWKGSAPRSTSFTTDPTLPSGWYRVATGDYTNSGFDRGHMCPSDDRDFSTSENQETFRMTNIVPQAPNNNQGPWAALETYCRTLAAAGNELYIISGPGGSGGSGSNGARTSIGNGVAVPSYTWKAIVVLPIGTGDAARVTSATRVIAVNMPNNQTTTANWGTYRVSVDAIESLLGYDLLSNVNTTVQATVESRVDNGPTQ
jgi:endonuclease G, mitochondrial